MNNIEKFYGPNAGYVLELYERYQHDPTSVDASTRDFFASWSAPSVEAVQTSVQVPKQASKNIERAFSTTQVAQIVAASALARAIRERGHLGAHLDPLGSEPIGDPALLPETYGITNDDLAHMSPKVVGGHSAEGAKNALEAINALRAMYSGTISYRV